jgi:hypothetical protein
LSQLIFTISARTALPSIAARSDEFEWRNLS